METIPYTSQMMSSVKEPVEFKLNTESPGGLFLLFFPRTQQHYGEYHNLLYGWVCFRNAIGQFAVRNFLYGPKFLKKMHISEL